MAGIITAGVLLFSPEAPAQLDPDTPGADIVYALRKAGHLERKISENEYAFFEILVGRDLYHPTDEELEEKTKQMIYDVNAKYALGTYFGLCQPYTYDQMRRDLDQENADRARMKEKGEVFYGPVSFDSIGFFNFKFSNLELEIINAMREELGPDMRDKSREFYHMNIKRYESIEEVRYEYTIKGTTEEIVVTLAEMKSMSRFGDILGDFLMSGEYEVGDLWEDEYTDEFGPVRRSAKILSVNIDKPSFEEIEFTVTLEYIREVFYPELIVSAVSLSNLSF